MRAIAFATLGLMLLAPAAAAEADFDVALREHELTARPQAAVAFEATIRNFASEPVRFRFETVGEAGRLQAVTPMPVTVQAAGQPVDEAVVPLVLHTPFQNGYVLDRSNATYRIVPTDPHDGTPLGGAVEVTVGVITRGLHVPGPQIFGAMLAIALAAFLMRRR